MPTTPKGPRLYKRTREDGGWVWQIRDKAKRISTGTQSLGAAEILLAEYIEAKPGQLVQLRHTN